MDLCDDCCEAANRLCLVLKMKVLSSRLSSPLTLQATTLIYSCSIMNIFYVNQLDPYACGYISEQTEVDIFHILYYVNKNKWQQDCLPGQLYNQSCFGMTRDSFYNAASFFYHVYIAVNRQKKNSRVLKNKSI